ncbi:hypothetical protein E2562_005059 [Oryza meyeriana var. granulata]|uniref:Uncharacterized protein n=1 Tax=Oryza meyeriana var. granulata TaxID=110450 RepID=A0A6G1BSY3_9ORYZ|nr:hypothetical protein E2562_005059 [Oryza meyeriana var. granulata]
MAPRRVHVASAFPPHLLRLFPLQGRESAALLLLVASSYSRRIDEKKLGGAAAGGLEHPASRPPCCCGSRRSRGFPTTAAVALSGKQLSTDLLSSVFAQ